MSVTAVPDAPPAEEEQLALFEGQRITKNTVNFSGNNEILEKALVDVLTLDSEVTLIVKAKVVSRGLKGKSDDAGNRLGAEAASNLSVKSISLYDES